MLNDEDLKGIDGAREAIRIAILDGSPEAYALAFTENGVVVHPDSPLVQGRDALKSYVSDLFKAVSITKLEFCPVTVEGSGGTAYEIGQQRVQASPASHQFKEERQHLHVYERGSDGIWRIAAAMSGNS
jgi:uncharacterized protein (TIGR02246 family)